MTTLEDVLKIMGSRNLFGRRKGQMVDLKDIAETIVEALKNAGFNNIQDSSGYFTIKEFKNCDFGRAVDVSKFKEDGEEYYAVYCSYENEDSDWKYTNDLSIESLLGVLQEVYDSEPIKLEF